MTIDKLISGLPNRQMSQDVFDLAMAGMMVDLPVWAAQVNATAAALNSIAAGGAYAIPYVFSTTTTDADPGAGFLRLGNATQNASTVMRLDLTSSAGTDYTAVLDTFDDSTSAIKGHLRLVKMGDPSKWLSFSITTLASPAGYRNLTVASTGGSVASPFANGDSVMLFFQRNGDKGDTGATGANGIVSAYIQTAEQTITNGGTLTIAHGLGLAPAAVFGFIRCTATNIGYSVGDITPIVLGPQGSTNNGVAVTIDATNIFIRFGNSGIQLMAKNDSTAIANISSASWKLFLRAFA